MSEESRKARNEYYKRWRENNREKCREYQIRYWKRVAEKNEQKSI